jgi:hypothetical protein
LRYIPGALPVLTFALSLAFWLLAAA